MHVMIINGSPRVRQYSNTEKDMHLQHMKLITELSLIILLIFLSMPMKQA